MKSSHPLSPTIAVDNAPSDIDRALELLSADYPIGKRNPSLHVTFEQSETHGSLEIARHGSEAVVSFGSKAMALRGLGTLMAGLVPTRGVYREQSHFATFGIMLDCSRNAVMRPEHFKGWLRKLALLGYNMAMLYTEDTYTLPGRPYFGYLRGPYTAAELRDIDAYAADLGITMIPCIQTLGHMEQALKWRSFSDVKDTSSVMLTGADATGKLIDEMLTFWKGVFKTDRIHIGMDETWDLGRGAYLRKHGLRSQFDIFNEHLARIVALCGRHGYKPMIWSDMYFDADGQSGYRTVGHAIPPKTARKIPRRAELVFWDYYTKDVAVYEDRLDHHRKAGFEPIMASGIWTWSRLWYDRTITEDTVAACIDACKRMGIQEVLFTMWGDGGAYCDFDSALAGLAFAAEKSFAGRADTAALQRRLSALCGGDYRAVRAASAIQTYTDAPPVLWDDPLLQIQMRHREKSAGGHLRSAARHYAALDRILASNRATSTAAGDLAYARLLCRVLSARLDCAARLGPAWKKKDRKALAEVRDLALDLRRQYHALNRSFSANWLRRNKAFGLEIQQFRFVMVAERYGELARRLEDYLKGRAPTIEELDAHLDGAPGGIDMAGHARFATCIGV